MKNFPKVIAKKDTVSIIAQVRNMQFEIIGLNRKIVTPKEVFVLTSRNTCCTLALKASLQDLLIFWKSHQFAILPNSPVTQKNEHSGCIPINK